MAVGGACCSSRGVVCMATKRNALGVLMGIELVLNGANVNFVAFGSRYLRGDGATLGLDGQLMALFVIVLAAAEAAVALAIALNFYNNHSTIDVDRATSTRRVGWSAATALAELCCWSPGLLPLVSFAVICGRLFAGPVRPSDPSPC